MRSGLPFEGEQVLAAPGTRRIYSNPGFDLLGALLAERTGRPFDEALRDAVLEPLGMTGTGLVDRPSQGLDGPLARPRRVRRASSSARPSLAASRLRRWRRPSAFPGLPGVVPGVGRFDPLRLGPRARAARREVAALDGRRATARRRSVTSVARHLPVGRPGRGLAVVVLTDRDFGPWALEAWPAFSDAIIDRWAGRSGR